ncbi:MAG: deoxyribodipyrimidine photo-lyase [Candidatus Kapabacteria bacterium]|nr:deoxyribodipyrimidine photo-lyase [Ignavibacteriota bacterium]MCW5884156.1 deoxyribodipyrimidine photo-lyase [Candidatus Kapabacteria bacterium]
MQKRTFKLQSGNFNDGDVLYWMSRDQRVDDNWALIEAFNESIKRGSQLYVTFVLAEKFEGASIRHFNFMLEGLKEVATRLQELNIHFILLKGNPPEVMADFVNEMLISTVYTDFDPLKIKRTWKKEFAEKTFATIYETDAHNIVPCRIVSEKQEYAAYTIRGKIKKLLPDYFTDYIKLDAHPFNQDVNNVFPYIDLSKYTLFPAISPYFNPGMSEARKRLKLFIDSKLNYYAELRNQPATNYQSDLSPYLHFGQISAQRVAWEVSLADADQKSKYDFLEELIIRKELSDNFCFYNNNYDSFDGFPNWAIKTLTEHENDERPYIYTLEHFENAETHDKYWNAAQMEMVITGKMHGYMRMYWAKKILEWTRSPKEALQFAIYLNDKYELDGRDPNGYAGIAWSIGGVHDRLWTERPIFGKIRYMNDKGLERKFDIKQYVEKVKNL